MLCSDRSWSTTLVKPYSGLYMETTWSFVKDNELHVQSWYNWVDNLVYLNTLLASKEYFDKYKAQRNTKASQCVRDHGGTHTLLIGRTRRKGQCWRCSAADRGGEVSWLLWLLLQLLLRNDGCWMMILFLQCIIIIDVIRRWSRGDQSSSVPRLGVASKGSSFRPWRRRRPLLLRHCL
jgi:hypothetical protein